MRWPSVSFDNIATHIGLVGSPAAYLSTRAITHDAWAAVAVAGITVVPAVANACVKIVQSRHAHRLQRITAEADARTAAIRAETHAELLKAGLDPEHASEAAKMLELECLNADLPAAQRMNDTDRTKLLRAFREPPPPGSPKPRSPKGPGGAAAANNVVNLRTRQRRSS
jgi:hypothetical protein